MSSGILVTHNAVFDMGVLSKCLSDYCIFWKESVKYCCTVQMGCRLLPGVKHELNFLYKYFGLDLDHHKVDRGSRACAEILLRYMNSGADVEKYIKNYRFQ